jgi:DNA polymerase I-like protein with 3'-5' exonuclease and polymerase domains
MLTVLDVENSVQHTVYTDRNGKQEKVLDLSPYHPKNELVSIGYNADPLKSADVGYLCFNHNELEADVNAFGITQEVLDNTGLLIGHNLKHDLAWLLSCGFKYDGALWDTMIAEYVLLRGIKRPIGLKHLAEKYNLTRKKADLTVDYLKQGVGFEAMPWDIVEEYGRGDIITTTELFNHQRGLFSDPDNAGLLPTFKMMCTFLPALLEMEKNGLCIDNDALLTLQTDYQKEYEEIDHRLHELAAGVMGDTPIRLTSPEFRSQLLYSRKVKDKAEWAEMFNIGTDVRGKKLKKPHLKPTVFNRLVRANTDVVSRTHVEVCTVCEGSGEIIKVKKNGELFKNLPKCSVCNGDGIIYKPTRQVGGFKLTPKNAEWTAQAGFATDKATLEILSSESSGDAAEFTTKSVRFNAISTYLSTFVEGILKHTGSDGVLHTHLNQCIAATGRLSSTAPNFHNQPRGKTFPIRKVVKSRFPGGKILEADYGQLEFRIAGFLAGCPKVASDVADGIDVHAYTRDIINAFDSEPDIDRNEAKSRTFKPLYGGMSGAPREVAYYKDFLIKYHGVQGWHERLKREALVTKKIRLPSGREYSFPYVKRMQGGYVQGTTQIVNYPVQGFATADLVPLSIIHLHREMQKVKCKSLLILTVHDSIEIDVYPGEEDMMVKMLQDSMFALPEMCREFYNIPFEYLIEVEIKMGENWLEMDEVAKVSRNLK